MPSDVAPDAFFRWPLPLLSSVATRIHADPRRFQPLTTCWLYFKFGFGIGQVRGGVQKHMY